MTDFDFDVVCVGHACYDLVFAVDHHPAADEKARAQGFVSCGGGTAANAALAAASLGARTAFAGYLGSDLYGDQHLAELAAAGVDTRLVVRGGLGTPISAIFVKPGGARSIVNYKGETNALALGDLPGSLADLQVKVMLFDGHEPQLALALVEWARARGIATVLDADTVNEGNRALVRRCTLVAASERFSQEWTGARSPQEGLAALAASAPAAVVTLGERGLIWQRGAERGSLPAFRVPVVDTTGAGDAFHGALAAGLAEGMGWLPLLRFASAAGALCCTQVGARVAVPQRREVEAMLAAG